MNPAYSLCLVVGLLVLFWFYAWLGLRLSTPVAAAESPRRFVSIDGLRGFLALTVFVHHAFCTRIWYTKGTWGTDGNRVILQAGWEPVTLFFFITGFLFWTKLQREPRLAFIPHLRSRLLRLGPAYWAAIAVLLLVVAVRSGGRLNVPVNSLLRSIGDWGFFTIPGRPDVNGLANTRDIIANVPWTLALEWMFYLLVPFVGWFASGVFRTVLFLGLVYVALQTLMWDYAILLLPGTVRSLALQTAYHLTRTFAGGILLAAMLPWLQTRLGRVDFKHPVFSGASLGGVLGVLLFADPVYAFRQSVPLLIPFALIALGNDWFGILSSAPSQFLGRISYSLYLVHGLVLHIVFLALNRFFPVSTIAPPVYWLSIALLGAVVILTAEHWFRWFEAPFISKRR
ncbi:MAG: acyltransferase [Opitutaceae bacterium]